jgi:hypothetical protein
MQSLVCNRRNPVKINNDLSYLDISLNIIYNINNDDVIIDISNNITFFTFKILTSYFNKCLECSPNIVDVNGNFLYLYLMDIYNKKYNNVPIIKFGYTYNMVERYKTLKIEFKTEIKLLGVKNINGEFEEKQFHNYLKNKYPLLIMNYIKPNNKKSNELYYFHPSLIQEFICYKFINLINYDQLHIEEEKTKQIEITEKTKQEIEKEKTKQEEEKTKQEKEKTKQEEEKTKQEIEKEKTKQLELIFKTKQLELKIEKIKLKK